MGYIGIFADSCDHNYDNDSYIKNGNMTMSKMTENRTNCKANPHMKQKIFKTICLIHKQCI